MNVLLERYPYRYVENGTLENGKPDFRIQKMDSYSPRWKRLLLERSARAPAARFHKLA